MATMGYRNIDRVEERLREGRLLRGRGRQLTIDPLAMSLLYHMAKNVYDWPPTPKMRRNYVAARCYDRGWDYVADLWQMTAVGGEKGWEAAQHEGGVEAAEKARLNTARGRISRAAKLLQQQGLIKLLVPSDIQLRKPAVWLLMIGDDEENAEVEAWARECYFLNNPASRPV